MTRASARLLVAEPDRLQAQLIDMLLASGPFELTLVDSGRDALRVLQGGTPDLALLAMDLPDLPGDEICGKIRRVTRLARMPVILIAPQGGRFGLSDEARGRARHAGADLVLPRPLGDKNLRERVQALVDASEEVPERDGLTTAVIAEALRDLDDVAPVEGNPSPSPPAAYAPYAPGDVANDAAEDDTTPDALRYEVETLRFENRQLKRKLAEAKKALAEGADPATTQQVAELERRNRSLAAALAEREDAGRRPGRSEGRGGGLFGRKR